jgi:hypothetical protein
VFDISGNLLGEGDTAYVLTNPTSGSKYKRLFAAVLVEDKSDSRGVFRCNENGREVSVTSCSVVVAKE